MDHTDLEQKILEVNEQLLLSAMREHDAREEAERANRMKDQFLAIISHELRTPLQAITGWVQLLRTGKLNAADADGALDVIDRNTRIQARLLADLLDVSRAMAGKLQINSAPLDLRSIVKAALDSVAVEVARKNMDLDVELPPSPVIVDGDAFRLQQIAGNLLSNAVKFTPKGGAVKIAVEVGDDWAHLRVTDSGQGFGSAFLETMFQPFTQKDATASRRHGGLGLGLMIVEHLVTAHGGRVRAESDGKDQGASFFVDLPLSDKVAAAGSESTHVVLPEEAMDRWLAGRRILLVEDHADSRELLRTDLQLCGRRSMRCWIGRRGAGAAKGCDG